MSTAYVVVWRNPRTGAVEHQVFEPRYLGPHAKRQASERMDTLKRYGCQVQLVTFEAIGA